MDSIGICNQPISELGSKYINFGVMLYAIKDGVDPLEAIEKATGQYGRFDDAVKKIDPRSE